MDHLQAAKRAIDTAIRTDRDEHAALNAQLAIAHAMVALVERMDRMAKTQELTLEHDEDLYAPPSN